jgi:biopolymer transport protein ExbD
MNDFFDTGRRNRQRLTVDIAPLMDMVFILLIFFIVTSTFTRETGVDVSKPQAQSASEVQKESIMIAITRSGTVHVNERQVSVKGLEDVLRQMLAKNPGREVVVIADKESVTGIMVDVIDAANLAGTKKISIAAMVE